MNRPIHDHCKEGSVGLHSQTPNQLAYSPDIQQSTPHSIHTSHLPKSRTATATPPDLIEGAEHYEVEKVLDSRLQKV